MQILRNFVKETLAQYSVSEAVITGRRLNRYTTAIKRYIISSLKDSDLRSEFKKSGQIMFRLDGVEELEDIDYLRHVIVIITDGSPSISAAYEFDLDATPKQREDSDLVIRLVLPSDFDNSLFSFIDEELTDAISHELEHSSQDTHELMDCLGDRVDATDIWQSLIDAAEYYMCPAEVAAHVTGFMKRAKKNRKPLGQVIDEELGFIYNAGLRSGYDSRELGDLMTNIRVAYYEYAARRYPRAQGI